MYEVLDKMLDLESGLRCMYRQEGGHTDEQCAQDVGPVDKMFGLWTRCWACGQDVGPEDEMLGLWTRCWAYERDVGPVHEMLDLKTGIDKNVNI